MFSRKPFVLAALLLLALLAACAPGQAAEPTTAPAADETPVAATPATDNAADAVSAAAVAQLAADLGLTETDVTVVSAAPTEFSDGCLGLGGPEESCLQAITPGWVVILNANGQEYAVHTDATGQQVRIAPDFVAGAADPEAATAAAVAHLAAELGVAEAEVNVVGLEAAEFSDGCLGLGGPEESCLQAITPGWVLTLSAGGQEYTVHTDATGQQARIAG
jgi:hypothetical protein